MFKLFSCAKWSVLCVMTLAGNSAGAQIGSGFEPEGNAIRDVAVDSDGRIIESSVIQAHPRMVEQEAITLSDPELEARIRVLGSEALTEWRLNSDAEFHAMWSPNSPEYRLAQQVDAELHKRHQAEKEARRESLGPLERLAVRDPGSAAARDALLPYRFSDTSRLFALLRDPVWADYWGTIAYTIAVVADEKSTLQLIGFIQDNEMPKGYEQSASRARLRAIGALPQTLRQQDIPYVIDFLERLTDIDYTESLNLRHGGIVKAMARNDAFSALGAIGDSRTTAILERLYAEAQARKKAMEVQALSSDKVELTLLEKRVDQDLTLLEMHLSRAKAKRLGATISQD